MSKFTMAPKVVLADGTVFENASFGFHEDKLWLTFEGKTIQEIYPYVSDSLLTMEIHGYLLNREFIYRGFTDLMLIQMGFEKKSVDVRLAGTEGYSVEEKEIKDESQDESQDESHDESQTEAE